MIALKNLLLLSTILLAGFPAVAQDPMAKHLADFDKLVSQIKASALIGEPIRAGETTVVPFAAVKFGLVSGNAKIAVGGGMTAKTSPLGLLILEGDDVRAELLPEPEEKPTPFQQLLQAILDRKVVIIGNGLNVGNASGTIQDLAPLISGLGSIISGSEIATIGNALNLGSLNVPKKSSEPSDTETKPPQKQEKQ